MTRLHTDMSHYKIHARKLKVRRDTADCIIVAKYLFDPSRLTPASHVPPIGDTYISMQFPLCLTMCQDIDMTYTASMQKLSEALCVYTSFLIFHPLPQECHVLNGVTPSARAPEHKDM